MKYNIANQFIDYIEYNIISFPLNSDIEILITNTWIRKTYKPYIDEWGIDPLATMDLLIERVYNLAIGNLVEIENKLPQPLMGRLMLREDLLMGIKVRKKGHIYKIIGDTGGLVRRFY